MTAFTGRTIPTTTLNGRSPVGRKYLANESGIILTTEDGAWIIAIDSQNTVLTGRPQITTPGGLFKISSDSFFKINSTDILETQIDYPYTLLTGRVIPS